MALIFMIMVVVFVIMVVVVISTTNVIHEVDGESRLGAKPMQVLGVVAESIQTQWTSLFCVVIWFICTTSSPMTLLSAPCTFSATEQTLLRKAFWWCSIPVSSPTRLWVGVSGRRRYRIFVFDSFKRWLVSRCGRLVSSKSSGHRPLT